MSLGEMIDFFLGTWPLKDILEMNELDRQEAQAFTRPSSEFYPQFEAAIRAGIDGWYAEGEDAVKPIRYSSEGDVDRAQLHRRLGADARYGRSTTFIPGPGPVEKKH